MNTVEVPFKHRFVYNKNGSPIWWQWCVDTFGEPTNSAYGIPASEHYWGLEPKKYVMWFADPAHATLFKLRWS